MLSQESPSWRGYLQRALVLHGLPVTASNNCALKLSAKQLALPLDPEPKRHLNRVLGLHARSCKDRNLLFKLPRTWLPLALALPR